MAKRSKRRNKNTSPNLPQETLDRARRQLAGEDVDANDESIDEAPEASVEAEPEEKVESTKARAERRSTRRKSKSSGIQFGQKVKRKGDVLDSETIEEMLAHPTKFVTEEELRGEYNYVLADLRNMGMLAAGLMVFLVGLAQFI